MSARETILEEPTFIGKVQPHEHKRIADWVAGLRKNGGKTTYKVFLTDKTNISLALNTTYIDNIWNYDEAVEAITSRISRNENIVGIILQERRITVNNSETKSRDTLAETTTAKVASDYLEHLASFKENALDAYKLTRIPCFNFRLEFVEIPVSDTDGVVKYDNGARYFRDNLITAHLPDIEGFRKDRSYRLLTIDTSLDFVEFVDEVFVQAKFVDLDLRDDTVEVTQRWREL